MWMLVNETDSNWRFVYKITMRFVINSQQCVGENENLDLEERRRICPVNRFVAAIVGKTVFFVRV